MKKLILLSILIINSILNLSATDILTINNRVISTELINKSLLTSNDKNTTFEQMETQDQKGLITTIIKAIAVHKAFDGMLSNEFYNTFEGVGYTYKSFYDFRVRELKKLNTTEEIYKLNSDILFYSIWAIQRIKFHSETTKISKEELKSLFQEFKEKMDIPEKRKFIFAVSDKKEKIEELINKFKKSAANEKPELAKILFEEAELNNKTDDNYKVIDRLYEEGVLKDELEEPFNDLIWNLKINSFNTEPIKYQNVYVVAYMFEYIAKEYANLEETDEQLQSSLMQYKIELKIQEDITDALTKSDIKTFENIDANQSK